MLNTLSQQETAIQTTVGHLIPHRMTTIKKTITNVGERVENGNSYTLLRRM